MDEVAWLMGWDLQAVVKGCTNNDDETQHHPLNCSHLISQQDDYLFYNFDEFSETAAVVDELEELYKPFYHVPVINNNIVSSPLPKEAEQVEALKLKPPHEKLGAVHDPVASKSKTIRKKKKERVVKEVREVEGISDGWGWRKYGQKPIKGSPYPRSYYRCSSCKGCLARKRVERSHLDPNVFIVTYTAQHKHPKPPRKNSQSGTTRSKIKGSLARTTTQDAPLVEIEKQEEEAFLDEEGGSDCLFHDQQLALDPGCGTFMCDFPDMWFNPSMYLT